ncbi:hypothetical protein [Streptomyces antarcticus]|uniref:hypothetical protein n=1 Tax=Streptomyces antarcticus TaxID=2996458 RepID=UPI002271E6D7|nr:MULTISPECIES: hypothetical protein [unclassified Streptomyces]MCY0941929.1 hypothetical protein [Streptomyces sp. H34-AA3]MCZ4082799.1 hypothetical protein [Streptomyces sp. H34-S5]
MPDNFWVVVRAQLEELKTAGTADDVIRILSAERNPYGHETIAADGFFAGSGGDYSVWDSLDDAGWTQIWAEWHGYYAMRAPDGSVITYVEGDIYKGDRRG